MRHSWPLLLLAGLAGPVEAAGPVVLYGNGPIVNLPNGGLGAAHASRVQGELGMTQLGVGSEFSTPSNPRFGEVSDNFTIDTPGGWQVTSITIYSLPSLTWTGCAGGPHANMGFYLGDAPSSEANFSYVGPVTPVWTGIYRVPSGDAANVSCPVYATTIPMSLDLQPGTYWVGWEIGITGIGQLPATVPVTRAGAAATGDALSRAWVCDPFSGGCLPEPWVPIVDVGQQGLAFEVRGTTQSVVKGNLDGVRSADLLLRNTNPASPDHGRVKAWLMNGTSRTGEAFVMPDPPAGWALAGSDDFDSWSAPGRGSDGQTDLVFYDESTGQVAFWLMNGTTRVGTPLPLTGAPPLPLDWRVAATGDFDGDGRPDLIWRNGATRKLAIWRLHGTALAGTLVPTPDEAAHANWSIVAALDYNGDGDRDLLWYNATSGNIVTWYMNAAAQRLSGQFVNPPNAGHLNWKVVAGGDYSWSQVPGTPPLQSPDIVWRNETSGKQVVWHMDFASTRLHGEFTNPPASDAPLDWTVVGPR